MAIELLGLKRPTASLLYVTMAITSVFADLLSSVRQCVTFEETPVSRRAERKDPRQQLGNIARRHTTRHELDHLDYLSEFSERHKEE
jgi:hypothetical protein